MKIQWKKIYFELYNAWYVTDCNNLIDIKEDGMDKHLTYNQ